MDGPHSIFHGDQSHRKACQVHSFIRMVQDLLPHPREHDITRNRQANEGEDRQERPEPEYQEEHTKSEKFMVPWYSDRLQGADRKTRRYVEPCWSEVPEGCPLSTPQATDRTARNSPDAFTPRHWRVRVGLRVAIQ